MKIDQACRCDAPVFKFLPAIKTKDTFDEIVAQYRIIKAALFLDGQQGLGHGKRSSILSHAVT